MSENKKGSDSNIFHKAISDSEAFFEKNLTYISAGALGISLTFIEKIVKLDESNGLHFLIIGWVLLVVTLAINLMSHLISKYFILKSQKEYNNKVENLIPKIEKRNMIIDSINWLTVILLILGIASIVVFTSINAYNQKNTPKNETRHV